MYAIWNNRLKRYISDSLEGIPELYVDFDKSKLHEDEELVKMCVIPEKVVLKIIEQAYWDFAHWKNGEQFVGTCGTKLKDAIKNINVDFHIQRAENLL